VYRPARQHALERRVEPAQRDAALAADRDPARARVDRERLGGAVDPGRRFERQPALRAALGRRARPDANEQAARECEDRCAVHAPCTGSKPRAAVAQRAIPRRFGRARAHGRDRALDSAPRTSL
jgi:hypothetical protein